MAKQTDNGKKAERIICTYLRHQGYWVHDTGRTNSGSQPVDIIAMKGNAFNDLCHVMLLDAKYIRAEDASFPFSRIEPNQMTSLDYASHYAGVSEDCLGFGIVSGRNENDIRFLPLTQLRDLKENDKKSVRWEELSPLWAFIKTKDGDYDKGW